MHSIFCSLKAPVLILSIAVLALAVPSETFAEEVTMRFGNGNSLKLPVSDLIDESTRQKVPCLSNTDLISAFYEVDSRSRVTWENLNNILRIEVENQRFTLFLDYSNMMANESLVSVKHSLKLFEGEVYIPISSLQMLLKFLGDVALEVPEDIRRREGAAIPALPEPTGTAQNERTGNLLPAMPRQDDALQFPGDTSHGAPFFEDTKRVLIDLSGLYALKVPPAQKEELAAIYTDIAQSCGTDLSVSSNIEFILFNPQKVMPVAERLDRISAQNPDAVIFLKPGLSRFAEVEGIHIYYPGRRNDQSTVPLPPSDSVNELPRRDQNYRQSLAETQRLARIMADAFSNSPTIQVAEPRPTSLYIAHRLKSPALMIELGYYSNTNDDQLLRRERDYFSRVLAQGIRDFLRQ